MIEHKTIETSYAMFQISLWCKWCRCPFKYNQKIQTYDFQILGHIIIQHEPKRLKSKTQQEITKSHHYFDSQIYFWRAWGIISNKTKWCDQHIPLPHYHEHLYPPPSWTEFLPPSQPTNMNTFNTLPPLPYHHEHLWLYMSNCELFWQSFLNQNEATTFLAKTDKNNM